MIGTTLDHYRIVERIGAGGMGVVYRAVDERLHRDVAVKVLPGGSLDDDEARRRFHKEALTLSKLNHPNIATIYDFYSQDDTDFLVMEYIAGQTLNQLIENGPLSQQDVARLGAQIVEALAAAHEQGIVHRDLKPRNIIVTAKGQVKVLDFGLAKLLVPLSDDAPTMEQTEKGVARGTLPYMSPEQLLDEPVGPLSDIYAAGTVLYEMATGRRPHLDLQGPRLIDAILHQEPAPPSSLRPEVPPELEQTILKALSKAPSQRMQTAEEFTEELKRVSLSLSLSAASRSRPGVVKRWLVAAVLAVAAGLSVVWMTDRMGALDVVQEETSSPIVAVLPFVNLSGDDSINHLGVGMAHSLITSLSSLPTLTVVSPSSNLANEYANRTAADVARDLGATYVVTGAIQRVGDQLHLTANLVRPDNSVAWGGDSIGPLDDLFSLQHALAERLSEALQPVLSEADRKRLTTPPTRNTEAFGDYTQAFSFLERPDVAGNIDRATRLFESAIEKDRRFALAHAGLGEAFWEKYNRTGDAAWTEKAREATLEALRLDSNHGRVRYSLAIIYRGTGRNDEAVEELERVIELQPNNDDAHRLLAEILAARGDMDAAVAEFDQAIQIRPNFWGNHRALGLAYFRAGELDEAAKAFVRVTELQPDSSSGFQTLGTVYHVAGDVVRAIENYERSIEVRPNAPAYSNLGTIHYRRGDFDEAVRYYLEAIELAPNALRYRNLGDAYQRLGQGTEAREAFERAKQLIQARLEVNPEDADAIGALAVYEAKLGESSAAMQHADEAVTLAPSSAEVLFRRAVVHALVGDSADAVRHLSEALEHNFSASEAEQNDDLEKLRSLEEFQNVMRRYR